MTADPSTTKEAVVNAASAASGGDYLVPLRYVHGRLGATADRALVRCEADSE